jgi:hypothetical protein
MYIFLISDRQWGTEHQYLFSRFLGVSILQLLIIYRIYDHDMLTLNKFRMLVIVYVTIEITSSMSCLVASCIEHMLYQYVVSNHVNSDYVPSFSCLDVWTNYNGSFIKAKNKLVQKAQKTLYSVKRKVRNLCIPVDLQLKLFDSIVLPILTYSCKVWGFENCAEIEKTR